MQSSGIVRPSDRGVGVVVLAWSVKKGSHDGASGGGNGGVERVPRRGKYDRPVGNRCAAE